MDGQLLDDLELSGTVVTIDAMGCQRAIAAKIVEKNTDYILAAKENQGNLFAEIKDSFFSDRIGESGRGTRTMTAGERGACPKMFLLF